MSDKNFKVKNKVVVSGLTGGAGPVVADGSNVLDSVSNLPTQYGGTGTTTSPTAGQVLYSSEGTTYAPTAFTSLPGVYARGNTSSRPGSPNVGDLYYNTELNYFEVYTSNGWFPIAAAPGIPTGVSATNQGSGRAYNNGRMSVSFSPDTNGGAPTSFIVTPNPTTSPSTFTGSSSPITVTGLSSSTQYTYTVQSTSPYGTSSASSASSAVTATTVPQAPTINSVTAGNAEASVTFTAGATGGAAISSYTVTSSPDSITASGSSSPITVTGLTNGTAYTFTLTATNSNGTSLASSASSSITPTAFTPTGSMDALATYTVPSGVVSSITFAGLPTGGQYTHLQIRVTGRTDSAGNRVSTAVQFNGDTTSNYRWHTLAGTGAVVVGEDAGSLVTFVRIGSSNIPKGDADANIFGVSVADILDYTNNVKNKVTRSLSGQDQNNTNGRIALQSGLWLNTNPITSIKIYPDDGSSWAQYTNISLYGVKG